MGKKLEQRLCDPNETARGGFVFAYFVNPITRQELLQILTIYDLRLDSVVIGIKDSSKSWNQIGPMLRPALGRVELQRPLSEILKDERWPLSDADRKVIEAYENNEPVVWSIKIENSPLGKILPFFLEYDRKQHRLGVLIDKFTGRPRDGLNIPINEIQPKTSGQKLSIERCYPK